MSDVKLLEILSVRSINLSDTTVASGIYARYLYGGYYIHGTNVTIKGSLHLDYYTNINIDTYSGKLPSSVKVVGYLNLDGAGFSELPEYLWVTKSVFMNDMKNLKKLPKDLRVGTDFVATGCTALEELPKAKLGKPYMGGVKSINLTDCTALKKLPENLKTHFLRISNCTALESLPEGLQAHNIDASGCTSLVKLPDSLKAVELDLTGCTKLEKLPNNLEVGRLRLQGCTGLPKNISRWTKNVRNVFR